MNIKRYNISKPEKYSNKGGEEKTKWNNIGEMVEFIKDDGKVSRIIKIPAIGLEANIFPIEPKAKQNVENDYPEEGEDIL